MRTLASASLLAALLASAPAPASIIATTGAISQIGAPATTELNQLQSNSTIFLFSELSNTTLGNLVITDVAAPGSYSSANLPSNGSGSIAAGTMVDSYFVHYDVTSGGVINSGSVSFDVPVLGIILSTSTLELGTDGSLGAPGTTYIPVGGNAGRGLDFGPDLITLSPDLLTVTLTLQAAPPQVDQIRIITQSLLAVPEPGTALLFGSGLAGLALRLRRRA